MLELKELIFEMGLLFPQQLPPEKIKAYADFLIDLEIHQVRFAFKKIIKNGNNYFPSIGEIFKVLRTEEIDESPMVANEIIKLIRNYGPHDEEAMIKVASEKCKIVLTAIGGTHQIRNSENLEIVRAQIERLTKAVIAKSKSEKLINEFNEFKFIPLKSIN